jgi:hypothetical protein
LEDLGVNGIIISCGQRKGGRKEGMGCTGVKWLCVDGSGGLFGQENEDWPSGTGGSFLTCKENVSFSRRILLCECQFQL